MLEHSVRGMQMRTKPNFSEEPVILKLHRNPQSSLRPRPSGHAATLLGTTAKGADQA